jgi:hypothetical protein
VLTRWIIPALYSTFVRITTVAFQVKLHGLAPANPAIETRVPSQVVYLLWMGGRLGNRR